jgi:hypothetical protein
MKYDENDVGMILFELQNLAKHTLENMESK